MNIIPVKHVEQALEIVIPGGLIFLQNPQYNQDIHSDYGDIRYCLNDTTALKTSLLKFKLH